MVLTFCYLCQLAPFVRKDHFNLRSTDDTFVMVLECTDKTNETEAINFLQSIGAKDAETIAAEMGLDNPEALTALPNFAAWAMLMRNDNPAGTIRIVTIEPEPLVTGRAHAVIARTRSKHTRPRAVVEERINRFLRPT